MWPGHPWVLLPSSCSGTVVRPRFVYFRWHKRSPESKGEKIRSVKCTQGYGRADGWETWLLGDKGNPMRAQDLSVLQSLETLRDI